MKSRCTQGRVRFAELGLILLFWVGSLCLPAATVTRDEPNPEEALRTRVGEFCSLVQAGRWIAADAYVTEESKGRFLTWDMKKRFLGFEVKSVKFDGDGHEAHVTVLIKIAGAFSPMPLPAPWITRWRLVGGLWYLVAGNAQHRTPPELPKYTTVGNPSASIPSTEKLKFKGHSYGLGIIQPDQVKAARFPFSNVTDYVVTITDVLTGCDCLRVKMKKKEYQPGESGELVIEFESTGYRDSYSQTILVKTAPGDLTTRLRVHGYVAYRR